jgi:hypothetical protein
MYFFYVIYLCFAAIPHICMVYMLRKVILFTLLLASCMVNTYAQPFPVCKDSLSASPFYPCPSVEFYPVCGCDNQTYRNECEARFRNGVNFYTDGSCSGFEMDILPTYISSTSNYSTTFTLVQAGNPNFARLVIVDSFGRLWLQRELPPANRFSFSLDLLELRYGVYYMYVFSTQGAYRYKSFVRTQ